MSGRGETPKSMDPDEINLAFGQTLYTEAGHAVGTVRGFEDGGIYLTVRNGAESLSVEHARSGHSFGEAELMWRCMNCGQMGEIAGDLPGTCPNCGVPKEDLMYWTED